VIDVKHVARNEYDLLLYMVDIKRVLRDVSLLKSHGVYNLTISFGPGL